MIQIIRVILTFTFSAWSWCSVIVFVASAISPELGSRVRRSLVGWIRYELMPFRWAIAVGIQVTGIIDGDGRGPWAVAAALAYYFNCWMFRPRDDEDDDRWKRRRKKLASKIAEVSGRLQVVPAGAR